MVLDGARQLDAHIQVGAYRQGDHAAVTNHGLRGKLDYRTDWRQASPPTPPVKGNPGPVVVVSSRASTKKCRYLMIIFRRDQPSEEAPQSRHCIHVATVLSDRAHPIRETGAVEVGRVC